MVPWVSTDCICDLVEPVRVVVFGSVGIVGFVKGTRDSAGIGDGSISSQISREVASVQSARFQRRQSPGFVSLIEESIISEDDIVPVVVIER